MVRSRIRGEYEGRNVSTPLALTPIRTSAISPTPTQVSEDNTGRLSRWPLVFPACASLWRALPAHVQDRDHDHFVADDLKADREGKPACEHAPDTLKENRIQQPGRVRPRAEP